MHAALKGVGLLSELAGVSACQHPGSEEQKGDGRAAPEPKALGALVGGHLVASLIFAAALTMALHMADSERPPTTSSQA